MAEHLVDVVDPARPDLVPDLRDQRVQQLGGDDLGPELGRLAGARGTRLRPPRGRRRGAQSATVRTARSTSGSIVAPVSPSSSATRAGSAGAVGQRDRNRGGIARRRAAQHVECQLEVVDRPGQRPDRLHQIHRRRAVVRRQHRRARRHAGRRAQPDDLAEGRGHADRAAVVGARCRAAPCPPPPPPRRRPSSRPPTGCGRAGSASRRRAR